MVKVTDVITNTARVYGVLRNCIINKHKDAGNNVQLETKLVKINYLVTNDFVLYWLKFNFDDYF